MDFYFEKRKRKINTMDCFYCNMTDVSLYHWIFECSMQNNLRVKHSLEYLNYNVINKVDLVLDNPHERLICNIYIYKFVEDLYENVFASFPVLFRR